MTSLSGTTLRLYPNKDRIFEPIRNLLIIVDALSISAIAITVGKFEGKLGEFAGANCKQFDFEVRLPLVAPTLSAVTGTNLAFIELSFFPSHGVFPGRKIVTTGYSNVTMNLITPIFVDFFERHRPWIKSTFGGDANAWPPTLNFVRVIRNFISHHHGRAHFDNSNAPTVHWHHVSYSPADEGKKVIGADLELGDMIVLMVEFSQNLDLLGCPIDP